MATKKNAQVESNEAEIAAAEATGEVASSAPFNRNRRSMMIELSDETLASIEEAAANFSTFGLKVPAARDMVAREIERLASGVSATALFAAEVQAKLAALAGNK